MLLKCAQLVQCISKLNLIFFNFTALLQLALKVYRISFFKKWCLKVNLLKSINV